MDYIVKIGKYAFDHDVFYFYKNRNVINEIHGFSELLTRIGLYVKLLIMSEVFNVFVHCCNINHNVYLVGYYHIDEDIN